MTVTTAFTTSMLAWGLLTFPRGYARAGETRHALDSIKWGADYLLKTFHPESGRKGGYTMVYQVGNLTTDFDTWATPENMTEREVCFFFLSFGREGEWREKKKEKRAAFF